jgi:hypothetical protein
MYRATLHVRATPVSVNSLSASATFALACMALPWRTIYTVFIGRIYFLVNIQNNFKRKSDIRKFTDTAFKIILYGSSAFKNTGFSRPLENLFEIIILEARRGDG